MFVCVWFALFNEVTVFVYKVISRVIINQKSNILIQRFT